MKLPRFLRSSSLAATILSLHAAASASAADYYWTADGTSGNLGGSGDWHTLGTWAQKDEDGTTWITPVGNWNNDGTAVALFTNASGTTTMNANVNAKSILLNVGQTIEGSGTLTIGVDGVSLSISNAHIATQIIGENLTFTLTNSTLTLSGNNTGVIGDSTVLFSSTTKLMQLVSANALGASNVTLFGSGGILNLGNGSAANISYNASELNMGTGTSLIAANSGVSTWTGTVSPTGTTTVLGTIENAAAKLKVDGDVNLATRAITAATSNSSLGIEINGVISGTTGSITTSGTQRLALGGVNTFTGTLDLTQNTAQLALTNVDALQAATLDTKTSGTQTVTFEVAGTNTYNIGALNGTDNLAIGANTLSIGAKTTVASLYGGIMSGTGGGLTKVGTNTLTLTNANTYDGLTSIKNGTLALTTGNDRLNTTGSMVIGDTSTAGKLVLGTSTLAVSQTLAGLTATGSKGNVVGANDTTDSVLTLNIGSGTNTYSGILGGTGTNENKLALTKTGGGTLALGDANSYAGVTTITAGTLSVGTLAAGGTNSSIGKSTSAAANLVFDGGTLQYTGSTVTTDRGFTLNAGKVGTIEVTTNNLTISGASATTSGGLTKSGSGTLTLGGGNTYGGVTTIAAGTLSVGTLAAGGQTSSIGNSSNAVTNLVFDGGTLQYTGSTVSTDRAFTINSGKVGTIEVTTNASILTISGASATTSGGLTKTGSGILELTATNTYSGTTKVNAGVLNVTGSLASGSVVTVGGDGSSGTPTLAGNGTINGATTIAAKGTGVEGIHAPSLQQTFGSSLTYNTGSIFEWDLASSAKGTRGSTYDAVNVAAISGSGAVFKVVLGGGGSFSETFWNSN